MTTVYIVVVEHIDGDKRYVSETRHVDSFWGDVTESLFSLKEYAEQVLEKNQAYYKYDLTVKQVYLKEVEL